MRHREVSNPVGNPLSKRAQMVIARLAYIERHGARFLFNNEPPPAPGWPAPLRVKEQE